MKRCVKCRKVNADDALKCISCGEDQWEAVEANESGRGSSSGRGAGGGESDAEKAFLDQIKQFAYDNQVRDPKVIVFFGHSNSGKSWFITRVKLQKGDLGYFGEHPPIGQEGKQLGTSKAPKAHLIHCAPKDGIVLVDIEGERFTDALENGFRGEYRVFIEALAHAHGFAFLLPAAEALYPGLHENYALNGMDADQADEQMQLVLDNIGRVNSFLGYLQGQKKAGLKTDQAVDAFLSLDDDARTRLLNAGVRKGGRTKLPAMILLSKADSLERLMKSSGEAWVSYAPFFDHDPMGDIVNSNGPARLMLKAFRHSFRRFRVDFVTAFEGHVEFPEGAAERDITWDRHKPHRGVVSAIKWLSDEISASRGWRRFFSFNLGVGPALWLRGRLDERFRRAT